MSEEITVTTQDPGYITVKVAKLPGRAQEVILNGGRTPRVAFVAADLYYDNEEIRVNGAPAALDTPLNNGDVVLMVRRIRGN